MPMPPLVDPVVELAPAERARTARHARLAGFGDEGQRRLAAAHVAIIGAGGLGSPAVLALAAAGVGTITIVDDDVVEPSNLQRQVMHRRVDVGAPKVDSAVRVAADLGSATHVRAVQARIGDADSDALLAGVDVVLDGTDDFDSRLAVASACERLGLPLVWGSLQGFDAQVTLLWSAPPAGWQPVVLADLHPPESVGEVPSCEDVGVLGSLCMQVGAIMATEAIKLVAGIGAPLLGRVLVIDALGSRQREVPLASASAAPSVPAGPATLDARSLAADLAARTIVDVREPHETSAGVIAGAAIVPLADLLEGGSATLPDTTHVVLVCEAGPRARRAARRLADDGIEATVLDGGMRAWRDADLPIATPA